MIVADASALASLARAGVLGLAGDEFDLHTTESSVEALIETSARHGPRGDGARAALGQRARFVDHEAVTANVETTRIEATQGDCAALAVELDAEALLTDDLRAIAELDRLVPCVVVPSPVVLASLVRRGQLATADAQFRLEDLVVGPRWLAGPVIRRVATSFDAATG